MAGIPYLIHSPCVCFTGIFFFRRFEVKEMLCYTETGIKNRYCFHIDEKRRDHDEKSIIC